MNTIDFFDLEYNGYDFRAELILDEFPESPWERQTGVPISGWERYRKKEPGELILVEGDFPRRRIFYNFSEAVKIARRDGWVSLPGDVTVTMDDGSTFCHYNDGPGIVSCAAAGLSIRDSTSVGRGFGTLYDAWRDTMTVGECAAHAARHDYDRLRRWCDGDWQYIDVCVSPICENCGQPDYTKMSVLGGIESDAGEYITRVAHELAHGILADA